MSKLKALLLTIRNETTPIAGHTDPLALNDVWREVFEIVDATEQSVQRTCAKRDEPDPLGMDIDEPWTESP